MKTVKVNHVVLTLRISPHGTGEPQAVIDERVNARLAEGYDSVEVSLARTNYNERQEATDLVLLYVFKKYEDTKTSAKSAKTE